MESTVAAAAAVSLSAGAGVTTAELLSGRDAGGALVSAAEAAADEEEAGAERTSDTEEEVVEEAEVLDVTKASAVVVEIEETGAASLFHGCKINKRMTVSNKTAKTAPAANNSF